MGHTQRTLSHTKEEVNNTEYTTKDPREKASRICFLTPPPACLNLPPLLHSRVCETTRIPRRRHLFPEARKKKISTFSKTTKPPRRCSTTALDQKQTARSRECSYSSRARVSFSALSWSRTRTRKRLHKERAKMCCLAPTAKRIARRRHHQHRGCCYRTQMSLRIPTTIWTMCSMVMIFGNRRTRGCCWRSSRRLRSG